MTEHLRSLIIARRAAGYSLDCIAGEVQALLDSHKKMNGDKSRTTKQAAFHAVGEALMRGE